MFPSSAQFLTCEMARTLPSSPVIPFARRDNTSRLWHNPDYATVMGPTSGIVGCLLNCGRGTYGLKVASISGKTMAELIDSGLPSDLVISFSLHRLSFGTLVNEKGATSPPALYRLG